MTKIIIVDYSLEIVIAIIDFFFKQNKGKMMHGIIMLNKKKEKKSGLLKLYISFTIKQTTFQITVTFYSTIYIIRAPD